MKAKWKNALALIVATMVSSTVASVTASAETTGSSIPIVTYDYVTKTTSNSVLDMDELRSYNRELMTELEMNEESANEAYNPALMADNAIGVLDPDSIIPPDDQVQVNPNYYPYSAVLMLRLGRDTDNDGSINVWSRGTGFLEGNDVMVTAGHCFWSTANGWVDECRIYSKQNSSTPNTTYYHLWSWVCSTAYANSTYADPNFDWCVVTLQDNLGGTNGWFGRKVGEDEPSYQVTISGYPYSGSKSGFQYKDSGYIDSSTTYIYNYEIDTEGGQSGSPIYDANNDAIGVHTSTTTGTMNHGVRITNDLYNIILNRYLEGVERWS